MKKNRRRRRRKGGGGVLFHSTVRCYYTLVITSPVSLADSLHRAWLQDKVWSRNTSKWPAKPFLLEQNNIWCARCCTKREGGCKKPGLSKSAFFIVGINLFSRTTNDSLMLLWGFYFFSFICLSDINYIFIYRICKKELRNAGEGKLIKN